MAGATVIALYGVAQIKGTTEQDQVIFMGKKTSSLIIDAGYEDMSSRRHSSGCHEFGEDRLRDGDMA